MGDSVQPRPDDEVLRAFIAVDIGDAVRGRLAETANLLREAGAHVSWVPPENIHLTFSFLGDIFYAKVKALTAAMDRIAQDTVPFHLIVSGVGHFGLPRLPRVVWVGVEEPTGALAALHERLRDQVIALGIPQEKRPFRPHLTLGRVRSARGVGALTSALASAKNINFGGVDVTRLLLMQSRLDHRGARYSRLHEAPLKGAHTDGSESD